MKKSILLMISLICVAGVFAQQQGSFDMVVLRDRNDRTIKSYFQGIPIQFSTKSGNYVDGIVKKVERDSIFIQRFDVRRAMTVWGTQVQDTVSVYWIAYHTNEIAWIRKPKAKFEMVRNGSLFMVGGTAYSVLHLVNAAYLGEPVIWPTMALSAGAAATGYVMNRLRKRRYNIGSSYKLRYIDTSIEPDLKGK